MRETNRPQMTPGSDWHHKLRTGSGLAYPFSGEILIRKIPYLPGPRKDFISLTEPHDYM